MTSPPCRAPEVRLQVVIAMRDGLKNGQVSHVTPKWSITPPTESTLLDHDVPLLGAHLKGKSIALLVSGGIAAIRAPSIARALRRFGANVVAYVSAEALNYTTLRALEWATTQPVVAELTSDSEHLHKSSPFDAYVVAPATYNTINKFATGIADGVLTTTLACALRLMEKRKTKVLVVPTMHGDMHNSIFAENVDKLQKKGVLFVSPRDAFGKHNIPETRDLVNFVCRELAESPLKGVSVLVTAGPTPVFVDRVRILTNVFNGTLGISLAEHLWLSGVDVHLVLGRGLKRPFSGVTTTIVKTYDEYRHTVMELLSARAFQFGIFSAAVADYRPKEVCSGKMPSGEKSKSIELVPTPKVIDEVLAHFPNCRVVSFKLEVGATFKELEKIAGDRLSRGHFAVIANELSEISERRHVAHLFSGGRQPQEMRNLEEINAGITQLMENSLHSPPTAPAR